MFHLDIWDFKEENVSEEIRKKVLLEVENLSGKKVPDDNYEIFTRGYLDSLNVLHLIVFIENTYKIKINPFDISIDTLGTVNKIVEFIQEKINES